MSLNVSSGNTSITGNVTAVPTEQHPNVFYAGYISALGDTTIYTVPAGKKATILNYNLILNVGATPETTLIKADAVTIGGIAATGTATTLSSSVAEYNSTYANGIRLTSNQVLKINNGAVTNCGYSFQIYEENN